MVGLIQIVDIIMQDFQLSNYIGLRKCVTYSHET
jgi:hypothetical protein